MKFAVLALLAGTAFVAHAQTVSCKSALKPMEIRQQPTRGALFYCVDMTNVTTKPVKAIAGLRGVRDAVPETTTDLTPGQMVSVCLAPKQINGQREYMLNYKTIVLAVDTMPAADDKKFFYFVHGCTSR